MTETHQHALDEQELIAQARQARQQAYAPYSNFPVGAALLTKSGRVFTGANVENAVLSLSICAERNVIFQAVVDGECEFEAIAVVTEPGVTPCGACRQVMQEFDDGRFRIIVADTTDDYCTYTLAELLPAAFTTDSLPSPLS